MQAWKRKLKKVLEIGLNMSQEASNLTSALKGEKKTLGNWGEVQLERALQLAGLEENVHYRAQAHFKDEQGGRNYPDFVLNLPDEKTLNYRQQNVARGLRKCGEF